WQLVRGRLGPPLRRGAPVPGRPNQTSAPDRRALLASRSRRRRTAAVFAEPSRRAGSPPVAAEREVGGRVLRGGPGARTAGGNPRGRAAGKPLGVGDPARAAPVGRGRGARPAGAERPGQRPREPDRKTVRTE